MGKCRFGYGMPGVGAVQVAIATGIGMGLTFMTAACQPPAPAPRDPAPAAATAVSEPIPTAAAEPAPVRDPAPAAPTQQPPATGALAPADGTDGTDGTVTGEAPAVKAPVLEHRIHAANGPTAPAERQPTDGGKPAAKKRAAADTRNKASTHAKKGKVQRVHIFPPTTVGDLDAVAVTRFLKRNATKLKDCRGDKAHEVYVQLFVNKDGKITMAHPDPNRDPGDVDVARCVANYLKSASPVAGGTHGIAAFRVKLPPAAGGE